MMHETITKIGVPGGVVTAHELMPSTLCGQGKLPLVALHGGPGGYHDYFRQALEPLAAVRPVYFYDQLGSFESPATFGPDLIRMDRFVDELQAIMDAHNIKKAAILGQSFGACIAIDYTLKHSDRVEGLILSSPLISTPRWIADANRLLAAMPQKIQDDIRMHEAAGTTDHPDYGAAEMEFYNRHLCRMNPWPPEMLMGKLNRQIYNAMWGTSEFVCTGTLKNYDRFPDLPKLTMPVLLTCGRYDDATPGTVLAAADRLPDARVYIFEESAHMAMREQPIEYGGTVGDFVASLPQPRFQAPGPRPGLG